MDDMAAEIKRLRKQVQPAAAIIGAAESSLGLMKHAYSAPSPSPSPPPTPAQKATLASVVQKQQRLLEVVRQQRLHAEAARVLAFAEDEFVRVLEWGPALLADPAA